MQVTLLNNNKYTPKTQKARGIKALLEAHNPGWYYISGLQGTPEEINDLWNYLSSEFNNGNIFARPCPRTPRHGFVESRIIKTENELKQLLAETYAADPRGEMLYTRKIDAPISAVVTNNSLTLGPGHDGATAGKHSVTLDIATDLRQWVDKQPMRFYSYKYDIRRSVKPSHYAGLKPQSRMPFVEFVGSKPVQLRYGPTLEGYSGNWIPAYGTSASHVLSTNYLPSDMLALESELKAAIENYCPGELAVYAPGHSLSSHLAIQCISKGIAVFTTEHPRPMQPVKTSAYEPIPSVLQSKLAKSIPWKRTNLIEAIALVQATAAAKPSLTRTIMLYLASEIIIKAAIGACIAEHRYFKPEEFGELPAGPITAGYKPKQFPIGSMKREPFYTKAFRANIRDYSKSLMALGTLAIVEQDFNTGIWPSGFGGKKWAQCTTATSDALKAWLAINSYSLYSNWGGTIKQHVLNSAVDTLIGAMNILINVSHNGGKCLTKFVSESALNSITSMPAQHMLTEHMYHTLLSVTQEASSDNQQVVS